MAIATMTLQGRNVGAVVAVCKGGQPVMTVRYTTDRGRHRWYYRAKAVCGDRRRTTRQTGADDAVTSTCPRCLRDIVSGFLRMKHSQRYSREIFATYRKLLQKLVFN